MAPPTYQVCEACREQQRLGRGLLGSIAPFADDAQADHVRTNTRGSIVAAEFESAVQAFERLLLDFAASGGPFGDGLGLTLDHGAVTGELRHAGKHIQRELNVLTCGTEALLLSAQTDQTEASLLADGCPFGQRLARAFDFGGVG